MNLFDINFTIRFIFTILKKIDEDKKMKDKELREVECNILLLELL